MAYNYYPYFQQNQPNQGMQQPQQMQIPMQQGPTQPQVQNMTVQSNGVVLAPNEEFARNYPVAFGNSVTFRDETKPFMYVKTMGFSQMDKPTFYKYKRVDDEIVEQVPLEKEAVEPAKDFTADIEMIRSENEALRNEIAELKNELEDAVDAISSLKKRISSTGAGKKVT